MYEGGPCLGKGCRAIYHDGYYNKLTNHQRRLLKLAAQHRQLPGFDAAVDTLRDRQDAIAQQVRNAVTQPLAESTAILRRDPVSVQLDFPEDPWKNVPWTCIRHGCRDCNQCGDTGQFDRPLFEYYGMRWRYDHYRPCLNAMARLWSHCDKHNILFCEECREAGLTDNEGNTKLNQGKGKGKGKDPTPAKGDHLGQEGKGKAAKGFEPPKGGKGPGGPGKGKGKHDAYNFDAGKGDGNPKGGKKAKKGDQK